ncbi:hypothetical protein GGR92_004803 [Spirosoma lacussanchae]|uniref:hypothetical protein n=1 Tax=Spirosoma lacussanchae TaxID=1884249 RepID=UPI001109A8AB|nr:hypothetical protein [Spirosoma lacussanchae]
MTEPEAKKRIAQIEALQTSFDNRLATLNVDLLALLMESAETILASPKHLGKLLPGWEKRYHVPVLQQFGTDLLTIQTLNQGYFQGAIGEAMGGVQVNQVLFEQVEQRVESLMTDTFGIKPDGEIVSKGLFDLFSQDTTVRRQVQQFAYAQKTSGVGLERFKRNLKQFIVGDPTNPNAPQKGVWSRHYNTVAYDTYQQADRVAQQAFAEGLNMTAFLYLGGTIAGTRLFCRVRDGKVFLRSEIDKFGTAQDTYGGYENKATGFFSGKPKGNYVPFIHAGGWGCRHHYSAISDREAMRRRPDLGRNKKGILQIVENSNDRIEPPIAQPGRKPQKPVNRFGDDFTPATSIAEAKQFALTNKLMNQPGYDELPVEVANQINAGLFKAKKLYGVRPSGVEVVDFPGNYPMQTRVNNLGTYILQVNRKTLGAQADLAATLATFEQAERDLDWIDGTLAGVVSHEIGHMVHYEYLSNNQNKFGDFFAVLRKLRTDKPKFAVGSAYGQGKITEAIAEIYSLFDRDGASALSDQQRKFLNRQLGWKLK